MVQSVYIHIPFCVKKCKYCSFTSFETLEKILDSLEISYEDIFKYSHFLDKKFLIENIEKKLPTLDNEKLKFIYKMINEL